MADQKKREEPRVNTPAQQDEEDIIEEMGGERDPETGELLVDEEKIRELGAVDAETIREDRRVRSVANKQKTGKKGVSFGTDDPLAKYDGLLKVWGPNSLYIRVKRLTGAQVVHVIRSCPRSGDDLYTALMNVHGQHPEAEYELRFQSTDGHQWRGTGRITLPDTRPLSQQGQPAYAPPPYGMSPGYPPPSAAPQLAPQNPVEMVGQMFEMFQRFSNQKQQPQQPPPMMPPPPPAGSDMSTQMAWMQQMFEMFQQMQGRFQRPVQPVQPQPQPSPSQSSLSEQLALFRELNQMIREMQPAQPPMMRERPFYSPQQQPQQQPQRPADPLREAMSVVRTAFNTVEEMDSLFPGRRGGGYVPEAPKEQESGPVVVKDTGNGKLVYDASDGSLRGWDTLLTNVPDMIKWVGDVADKVKIEREKQQRRQELPPGYVEVGPGYKPPPGYVVVPIEQAPQSQTQTKQEEELPPPPTNMPPPIQNSWDMPPKDEG